ncbi:MAG: nucleotidyltransferase family protein [Candidatus Sabulitectum sp.]|nr:nucleotidyltransferase family protein [Candidatus Sabulitectum sp.]
MDKDRVIEILRMNQLLLRQFHVSSLSIFGSIARGDAGQKSDIDILVEFEPGATIGFFAFSRLQKSLSELFGRPVDLVTADALHMALKQNILKEAIHVV